jgi:hypothetical protein
MLCPIRVSRAAYLARATISAFAAIAGAILSCIVPVTARDGADVNAIDADVVSQALPESGDRAYPSRTGGRRSDFDLPVDVNQLRLRFQCE